MYSKNKCKQIMYQVILDNKVGVEFNTKMKRSAFLKKVGCSRNVTAISSVAYPWNVEDGIHNLKSPEDFAKIYGCDVSRVGRAIRNGKFKCEPLGGDLYIVEKNEYYEISGGCYRITKK